MALWVYDFQDFTMWLKFLLNRKTMLDNTDSKLTMVLGPSWVHHYWLPNTNNVQYYNISKREKYLANLLDLIKLKHIWKLAVIQNRSQMFLNGFWMT